jgi:hypothetical protein
MTDEAASRFEISVEPHFPLLEALEAHGIDGYVAPGRAKHPTAANGKIGGPLTQRMRNKIDDGGFETPYRLRKQVVEPVFGQIKQARGFRQFLLRGVEKVRAEWAMICTAQPLWRDRRSSVSRVKLVKVSRQSVQRFTDQRTDRAQRMIGRDTALQADVAEKNFRVPQIKGIKHMHRITLQPPRKTTFSAPC